jgi:hypothetical protein
MTGRELTEHYAQLARREAAVPDWVRGRLASTRPPSTLTPELEGRMLVEFLRRFGKELFG